MGHKAAPNIFIQEIYKVVRLGELNPAPLGYGTKRSAFHIYSDSATEEHEGAHAVSSFQGNPDNS